MGGQTDDGILKEEVMPVLKEEKELLDREIEDGVNV